MTPFFHKLSKLRYVLLVIFLFATVLGIILLIFLFKKKQPLQRGTSSFAIISKTRKRKYYVYIPRTYNSNKSSPVVIALHGGGGPIGTARLMMKLTGWTKKAEQENFLAVFPEGTPTDPNRPVEVVGKMRNIQEWADGSGRSQAEQRGVDDVAFINDLINNLNSHLNINNQRIFVTGFSNGASMAFRLGVELSERITAVAPVAGVLNFPNFKLKQPVSLISIVGSKDVMPKNIKIKRGERVYRGQDPVKKPVFLWANLLGCSINPQTDEIKDKIAINRYLQCRDNSQVISYNLGGLGHAYPGLAKLWPGSYDDDFKDIFLATDIIWNFFKKIKEPLNKSEIDCKNRKNKADQISCWGKSLEAKLKNEGLTATLALLAKYYRNYPDFAANCRYYTGIVGEEAYQQQSLPQKVTREFSLCGYGFYIGLLSEAFFKAKNDLVGLSDFCRRFDEKIVVGSLKLVLECYHGIGHSLIHDNKPYLQGDSNSKTGYALSRCAKISQNKIQKDYCVSGVFHEIADLLKTGQEGLFLNSQDPLELCRSQDSRNKKNCYIFLSRIILKIADMDLLKAAEMASDLSIVEPDFANTVVRHNAIKIAERDFSQKKPASSINLCYSLAAVYVLNCIDGYVNGLFYSGEPGFEYKTAFAGCRTLRNETDRKNCFNFVIPQLKNYYDQQKIKNICQGLEKNYQAICYKIAKK